jgi:urease accessory protein
LPDYNEDKQQTNKETNMKTNSFQSSRRFAWLPVALILLALVPQAQAHILHGEAGGFKSGFHHPWSGLDHICAMVAVGLWGAQLGGRAMWLLPVVFPMVMSVGGFFGLIGVPLPGQEIGIALSALLLGTMVCAEVRPKHLIWPAILVGAFGFYHGHAHGVELPPGQSGLLYSIGFVIATGTLHLCGITIGLLHRWSAGKLTIRLAGGAILACGVYFLWAALQPETKETAPEKAKVSAVEPANFWQNV